MGANVIYHTNKIRNIGICFVFFILVVTGISGLSFDEVIKKINETEEVKTAQLALLVAQKQLDLLRYPGNISGGVQPSGKTTDSALALSGSASLSIPLGLTETAQLNVSKTEDNLKLAETALSEARARALFNLYSKYQSAWLDQEERNVIEDEVKAAEASYAVMRSKFEAGDVSLIELAVAEEKLTQARESSIKGRLNERITWFELASAAGLNLNSSSVEEAIPKEGSLPKPPELSGKAYMNLSSIQNEIVKVKQIEDEINKLRNIDSGLSLKTFFNYETHSASAEYNFTSPNLTFAYSFPIATVPFGTGGTSSGTAGSAGSTDSLWNAGLSINLSLKTGKLTPLERASLNAALRLEESKLSFLKSSADLNVRTKYQQWILAGDMVKQVLRNLERAKNNKDILETKSNLGLAGEDALLEATALISRAEWNVSRARIEQEKARIAAASAAGYMLEDYK